MATYRSLSPQPADIITYRLGQSLVYVKPAIDYEQALDIAVKEFPGELGDIDRQRITFTIQATMSGTKRTVRISQSAWMSTITRMLRGEVIDVSVLPESPPTSKRCSSAEPPPPMYLEVPDSKEMAEFIGRQSRSTPGSRAGSRTRSREPSPSGTRVLSWFGGKF